jgi:hypothetical protein
MDKPGGQSELKYFRRVATRFDEKARNRMSGAGGVSRPIRDQGQVLVPRMPMPRRCTRAAQNADTPSAEAGRRVLMEGCLQQKGVAALLAG